MFPCLLIPNEAHEFIMCIEITLRFVASSRNKQNGKYLAFADDLVDCKGKVKTHMLHNEFLAAISCFPNLMSLYLHVIFTLNF